MQIDVNFQSNGGYWNVTQVNNVDRLYGSLDYLSISMTSRVAGVE